VYRRLLTLVAAVTIFLMVLPPLFDTFDTWDKTPELPVAGHNTETTITVLALETGLGIAVAWASVVLLAWLAAHFAVPLLSLPLPAQPEARGTEYQLLLFSPPALFTSLRI
jgi:hypothetical protein